jgi:hypothetical protein
VLDNNSVVMFSTELDRQYDSSEGFTLKLPANGNLIVQDENS